MTMQPPSYLTGELAPRLTIPNKNHGEIFAEAQHIFEPFRVALEQVPLEQRIVLFPNIRVPLTNTGEVMTTDPNYQGLAGWENKFRILTSHGATVLVARRSVKDPTTAYVLAETFAKPPGELGIKIATLWAILERAGNPKPTNGNHHMVRSLIARCSELPPEAELGNAHRIQTPVSYIANVRLLPSSIRRVY
jgi:hypothetical protein